MKKLNARVFLKAAEIIYKSDNIYDRLACVALDTASNQIFSASRRYFSEKFAPDGARYSFGKWYGEITPENQLARQLGLLLCAEVLKDEQEGERK